MKRILGRGPLFATASTAIVILLGTMAVVSIKPAPTQATPPTAVETPASVVGPVFVGPNEYLNLCASNLGDQAASVFFAFLNLADSTLLAPPDVMSLTPGQGSCQAISASQLGLANGGTLLGLVASAEPAQWGTRRSLAVSLQISEGAGQLTRLYVPVVQLPAVQLPASLTSAVGAGGQR